MAVTVVDVLKANMAFPGLRLLPGDGDFQAYREAMGTEVFLRRDEEQGLNVLLMSRERTTLLLTDEGSSIERQHLVQDDLPFLAEAISTCIAKSTLGDSLPEAFGYNLEFVAEQDSGSAAGEYLVSKLINGAISEGAPWDVVSGGFVLRFHEDDKVWNFTIEPRFNEAATSRIFVHVNLHRGERRLPEHNEIIESLTLAWDRTHLLIDTIDQGGR